MERYVWNECIPHQATHATCNRQMSDPKQSPRYICISLPQSCLSSRCRILIRFRISATAPRSHSAKPENRNGTKRKNEMKCCSCSCKQPRPRLQPLSLPLHAKRQFKYKVSKCGRFSYQLFIQLDARLALQMKMRTERERRWERERDCRATPTLWVFVKWKLRCGACGCNLYLVILHAVPQKIFEICTLGWPQAKLNEEISA